MAGLGRFSVGRECCDCSPCVFFEDAAPSDDDDWDDVSGILVANHTNPDHDLGTRYRFTVLPDTATDPAYFYCDFVDANNHHRVSVVSNGTNGTLQIHKVTGGTPAQLGTNLTISGWNGATPLTVEVCYTPPISIIATVNGVQRAVVSDHHGGEEFGLSGDATFTDFEAQALRSNCDDCSQVLNTCNACATSTVPNALAIKFSGVVSDRCDAAAINDIWFIATYTGCSTGAVIDWCADGEDNDTQVVGYSVNLPPAVRDNCDPNTAPNGSLINFNSLFINLYGLDGGNDWRIHVRAVIQASTNQDTPVFNGVWINSSSAPDCTTIENVIIPNTCDWIVADPPMGFSPAESYDFTNATVTVSVP